MMYIFDFLMTNDIYVFEFLSVVPDEIVDIKSAGKFCTSLDVTGGELNFKFDVNQI
jgi:hypothetical protein